MSIVWLVIATITLASIAGYVVLSITLNGPAPDWKDYGIAFVVQSASESTVDDVQLRVESVPAGDNSGFGYYVSACGPNPYSADLVFAGNARITPFTVTPGAKPQVENFYDSLYGDIQVAKVDLPKKPCPINSNQETSVTGFLYEPVQQNWSGPWNLWKGPHATLSWPQLGLTSAPTFFEPFSLTGIAGKLVPPRSLNIQAKQAFVPGWSIDSSIPSTPTPDNPLDRQSWSGANEISPSAQLTDTESVALFQDWIVVLAIVFGIGSAMLASLVFDWIRLGKPQVDSVDQRVLAGSGTPIGRLPQPTGMKRSAPTRIILLGLAFVIGYALRRKHRRQ